MGRTRRNCPVFGCGSTNLARLANHLDQVYGMDTEEGMKWLKWSKLGICVPRQSEGAKGAQYGKEFGKFIRATRGNGIERKFSVYFRNATLKHGDTSKRKTLEETRKDHNTWLTFLHFNLRPCTRLRKKVPLLPASNKRKVFKVLDVKPVEHKGQKRKLVLTEDGIVYKVKRSKLENNVKAGQYV